MSTLSENTYGFILDKEEKLIRNYVYTRLKNHDVTKIVTFKCEERYKFIMDVRDIDDIIKEKYYNILDPDYDDYRSISLKSVILMDELYGNQSTFTFLLDIANSDFGKIDINVKKKTLTILSSVGMSTTIASLYYDTSKLIQGYTFLDTALTNPVLYYLMLRPVCYTAGSDITNVNVQLHALSIKHWSEALYALGYPYKIEGLNASSDKCTVNIKIK